MGGWSCHQRNGSTRVLGVASPGPTPVVCPPYPTQGPSTAVPHDRGPLPSTVHTTTESRSGVPWHGPGVLRQHASRYGRGGWRRDGGSRGLTSGGGLPWSPVSRTKVIETEGRPDSRGVPADNLPTQGFRDPVAPGLTDTNLLLPWWRTLFWVGLLGPLPDRRSGSGIDRDPTGRCLPVIPRRPSPRYRTEPVRTRTAGDISSTQSVARSLSVLPGRGPRRRGSERGGWAVDHGHLNRRIADLVATLITKKLCLVVG